MTTAAPAFGDLLNREEARTQPYERPSAPAVEGAIPTTLPEQQVTRVIVISSGGSSSMMPTSLPATTLREPAALIVVASDGQPHPELWPGAATPVLVVLPPHAPPSLVVAAFQAGADACVCTGSSAEVTAHLGALLRRSAVQASRS